MGMWVREGIVVCILLNLVVWGWVVAADSGQDALYFFDVHQGDSEMIVVDGAKVLIDAGGGERVVEQLNNVIPSHAKRIDLMIISHPQADHMGGSFDVIKHYDVGVVIWNGDRNGLWEQFRIVLDEKKIPYLVMNRGDRIFIGETVIEVLWPSSDDSVYDVNERSLVMRMIHPLVTALYAGDIGAKSEKILMQNNITADILKVAHHGSGYSSSQDFLAAVSPAISVIEVGKNPYGHPTQQTLSRLESVGSVVLRTDKRGSIKLVPDVDRVVIFELSSL